MWFITVIRIDKEGKLSDSRCWGYYSKYEWCVEDLHTNNTDMAECYYNYAVIEEIPEGISMYPKNRQFFQYDIFGEGFFEILEPEWAKHFCNFAIG